MANIENKVEDLIKEKIEAIGYELYDIEYIKEGKDYYLRIYIDNKNGISLEDCEKVSNEINGTLDNANIISGQYYLEVSSPGVERIIRKDKHLQDNIGKEIEIKLFKKDEEGNKIYTGKLKSYNEESISIEKTDEIENNINQKEQIASEEKEISRKEIAQIKTIYKW